MRRKAQIVAVLLFAAAASIALIAATSGNAGGKASTGPSGYVGKGGAVIGKGGGFGETYQAPSTTLAHTLFKAKLLPTNKTARDISLAAFGRSTKTVNYTLALKCWKNNGCSTGTGGKQTVAYVEGFGENTYRQMSKMEFILQALTYPKIGKIIYMSAHSDLNQAIADFKSVIAQHVSAIVTYPDFGDAMIPVFQQATKAGIPVSTYAWGYVTGPGTNYTTVVGEDTCNLGKSFAYVMNNQVKSGNIAFLGGFPGNPLSARLAEVRASCAQLLDPRRRERPDELGSVEGPGHRRRDPGEVSGPEGDQLRGRALHVAGRLRGVQVRRYPLQGRVHLPDRRVCDGLPGRQAQGPGSQGLLLHSGQLADPNGPDR